MRRMLLVVGLLAGCPTTPPPACITVDTTCSPLYPPTFDNVYNMTLAKTCTSNGGSCHSASGNQADLSFTDEASSYAALMAPSHLDPSRTRVDPGDPACSLMIVRTDSPGAAYQMPPGDALSEPERCALIQWVQAGALPGSQ